MIRNPHLDDRVVVTTNHPDKMLRRRRGIIAYVWLTKPNEVTVKFGGAKLTYIDINLSYLRRLRR